VNGATVIATSVFGTTYKATIEFSTVGTFTVNFYDDWSLLDFIQVDVTSPCPFVPIPDANFSYTNNCGSTTIAITNSPPPNVAWYWPDGSCASCGASYTTTQSASWYLSAKSTLNLLCSSSGWQFTAPITVRRIPDAAASAQTICSNQSTSIALSNPNNAGTTTYSWTVVSSPNATGAFASSGNTISQSLSSADGVNSGSVTYSVTPTANGCNGTAINVTVTVQPVPQVANLPASTSLCSGAGFSFTPTATVGGSSLNWTSSISGTINASTVTSSGSSIITNSPQNTSNTAGTVAYAVTPSVNGCTGSTRAYTVTVNPIPTLSITANQTICSSQTASFTLSNPNAVSGTSISWTQSQTNTSGAANGSGASIAQALTNSNGLTNGTVNYTVTASASGCSSVAVATATVKPVPLITNPIAQLAVEGCSPFAVSFVPTSSLGSTTYSWTSSVTGGLTGNSVNGTGTIVNTLTNPSNTAVGTATYSIVPTANGCTGSSKNLVVTTNPKPSISVAGSTILLYGTPTTLSAASFNSYQWIKDGVSISGATLNNLSPASVGSYTLGVKRTATSPQCVSLPIALTIPVQTYAVNSVSTVRFFKAGVTLASLYSLAQKDLAQVTAYQDGLGRTFQTVAVGQSGTQTDLIGPVAYTRQGLTDSTFLPYAAAVKDGRFRFNAIRTAGATPVYTGSEQYQFYQGTSLVATDTKPYARSIHRTAPDARITEQGAVGNDWQPGTNHTVKNTITLNTASYPVRYWKIDGTTTGNYPAGTVMVSLGTDENGNAVRTFTNKNGQTILKQVQLDETISGSMVNWLQTYYIYDVFGRLKYQVPPKAVALVGVATSYNVASNSVTDELVYKYTYDSLGRVVEKKEPGAALKCFVFDKLGRVAFTQDGNLKATNQWYFVKYDFLNRPVYSGLFTSTLSRKSLQNQLRIMDLTTQPYYESPAVNATFQGYTNNAFPTTGTTLLTVNYYDSYDFDQNGTADYTYDNTHLAGLPAAASAKVRGLPTGSKKLVLGSSNWLVSVVFYDNLDRAIQTQSNNHLNTVVQDKSSVLYADLVHVDRTKATHTGPTVVTVEQRYAYDPNWRTLGIFHKINGGTEQQLVSYTYNILGQVVDKKLHVNGASFLQSVDMRYNIRGWLRSINNAQLANDANVTNDDTNDYFGMELSYNTAEASGLGNALYYNGNVSAAKWKGPNAPIGVADQRSYKYTYDKSDKLKSATFQANTGAAWTKEAGTLNEMMTYDHNGNMATLQRTQNNRGLTGTTVTSSPLTIDNLTYSYTTNTNRMLKVEDAIATTIGVGDFKNGSTAATEYTYTADGSQTADLNKGIKTITYNVLNKPQVVTYSGTPTKTVTYTYDAAGTKLKTVTVANSVTTTTDYVNNFVYTNNTLSFFSSPEGRVVKNGANYEYQYAIADHQGNTRVLFSSVTPTPSTLTATFEGTGGDNSNLFSNVNPTFVVPYGSANNTAGGVKVVRMNQTYSTGPAKSLKVYPGDKVDMETYCYYESASGYGSTNSTVATMLTSIASAFGGVSGGAGESGSIFNGINSALGQIGLAPNLGDGRPSAYLNYILFDQQYKVVDMGWTAVPSTASFAKQKISIPQITVKEAGYMFVYLSYETASNNWVYFDDFKVKQTKTNVLQYNEYYAYGLQTANSWTRENATGNNFLHNGGTELNTTTGVYDLEYRNYDPVLARMTQVDPMASQYSSLTPYNYSFNDPVTFNDPDGADPIKKEPLPTDANPDPGTGWGAWHLPGMGGSGSWRIGPGSGNHWSDQYRSAYDNAMLMSSNTFNSFYGINDDNRASFAASLGSYVPSAYYSTFFAAMGGGERKLGDAVINARHYFFHVDGSGNFYLPYTNTVVNPSDYLPSGSPDPRAGIGLSSGFESYAPVWGSGRDAIYWFQTQGGPGDGRGSAESFSFGFAFFFGISGEWGTVHDETGASKRYYTISANFGLGLDIGFNKKEIIPTDGSRFRVDQYKGFGKNLSMGAFFTSESRGGNYPTQTLDPFDMGTNYKERSNSYSPFLGIPVGFGLGDVGVLYQMGKTDFYK
jgi:RHS repeat-associated protein